ncbi:PilZ domain-containing protein [Candidatus Nitrospira bockiana]
MQLRHVRCQCRCPVLFESNGCVAEGSIVNLSLFGCAIRTPRCTIPGEYVRMHTWLPTKGLRVDLAKVRWCQPYQFGVEFIELAEPQRRLILQMIRDCLQKG